MSEDFRIQGIDNLIENTKSMYVPEKSVSRSTNPLNNIKIPAPLLEDPDAQRVQQLVQIAQDTKLGSPVSGYYPILPTKSIGTTSVSTYYGQPKNAYESIEFRSTGDRVVGLFGDLGNKMKIGAITMAGIFKSGANKERLALATGMMTGAIGTSLYARKQPILAMSSIIIGAVGSYLLWSRGHKQSVSTF